MAITPVPWPGGLPQCAASWDASFSDPAVRTELDGGHTKTRRRFTKPVRQVQITLKLRKDQVDLLRQFFENDTQGGTLPFLFTTPDRNNAKEPWRMKGPPSWSAVGTPLVAWQATLVLEQLPYWG